MTKIRLPLAVSSPPRRSAAPTAGPIPGSATSARTPTSTPSDANHTVPCRSMHGTSCRTACNCSDGTHKSCRATDRSGVEPARGLRYVASLLEKLRTESFPGSYSRHVEFNIRHCERLWQNWSVERAGEACSDCAQADSSCVRAGGNGGEGMIMKTWHRRIITLVGSSEE